MIRLHMVVWWQISSIQLHGKGPYLFKFYNYYYLSRYSNEEDWAYRGCEELIQDYHKKKNQIYLWI